MSLQATKKAVFNNMEKGFCQYVEKFTELCREKKCCTKRSVILTIVLGIINAMVFFACGLKMTAMTTGILIASAIYYIKRQERQKFENSWLDVDELPYCKK